ncbi:hypothetical protein SDJN03_09732, partial [Cucurbita argyrosperma subsp. sororia]
MAQKHLHELLKEDQEPFLLTNFIADRRVLKRPSPKSHLLHLNKRKPISHFSDFPASFCKGACFLSFNDSPDLRNPSPLFQFQSPVKSPCRNSNAVFLHVPATTAGLLLEAALRIQKQSTAARSNGFGLLGSFLKRFTHRGRSRKREIDGGCRRNDPRDDHQLPPINEKDSVSRQSNVTSSDFCDSPFRFVLQSSPSAGHRTPEFSSPPSSPARHDHQVNDVESLKKLPVQDEEEEKEQSSPVSVLDPPFEDDEEGRYEDGEDDDDYKMERSYAIVEKAKHQLLKKLRRFERLAELDPVELETFLLKDEEGELDDDDIDHLKEEECESHNFDRSNNEKDMKQHGIDGNVERVYMRWDLWKEVESSAIDVMAGEDLRAEVDDGWKRNGEARGDMAIEIEVEIFRLLVEEMQTEVDCFINNV